MSFCERAHLTRRRRHAASPLRRVSHIDDRESLSLALVYFSSRRHLRSNNHCRINHFFVKTEIHSDRHRALCDSASFAYSHLRNRTEIIATSILHEYLTGHLFGSLQQRRPGTQRRKRCTPRQRVAHSSKESKTARQLRTSNQRKEQHATCYVSQTKVNPKTNGARRCNRTDADRRRRGLRHASTTP